MNGRPAVLVFLPHDGHHRLNPHAVSVAVTGVRNTRSPSVRESAEEAQIIRKEVDVTTPLVPATANASVPPLRFVWLEITGKCQLACIHCYADSGPEGTHGTMTTEDWRRVISDVADADAALVQFIGGEPTLHPDLSELIDHALTLGLEVEVFSNLVHVPGALWEVFERPGVRLATSWYSDDAEEHAQITKRSTHARTLANITEGQAS